MKKIICSMLAFFMILVLTGCINKDKDNIRLGTLSSDFEIDDLDELKEEDNLASDEDSDFETIRFNSNNDLLMALESDVINVIESNEYAAKKIVKENDNYVLIEPNSGLIKHMSTKHGDQKLEELAKDKYVSVEDDFGLTHHMATRLSDKKLSDDLSKAIAILMRDGTMYKLTVDYLDNENIDNAANNTVGNGPTYVVGVSGEFAPIDYITEEGMPAGFNVAIMNELGKRMGCNFKFVQIDPNDKLAALETNQIDIVFINSFGKYKNNDLNSDKVCLTDCYANTVITYVTKKENEEKVRTWLESVIMK